MVIASSRRPEVASLRSRSMSQRSCWTGRSPIRSSGKAADAGAAVGEEEDPDLAELRPSGVDGLGHVVGGAGFLQFEMVAVAAAGGERQRPPELPVDLVLRDGLAEVAVARDGQVKDPPAVADRVPGDLHLAAA